MIFMSTVRLLGNVVQQGTHGLAVLLCIDATYKIIQDSRPAGGFPFREVP